MDGNIPALNSKQCVKQFLQPAFRDAKILLFSFYKVFNLELFAKQKKVLKSVFSKDAQNGESWS